MSKVKDIREMRRRGHTVAETSRRVGVSEPTVRKYLMQEDFSPRMPVRKALPSILDPYKPKISEWLAADRANWRKQRHTSRRVPSPRARPSRTRGHPWRLVGKDLGKPVGPPARPAQGHARNPSQIPSALVQVAVHPPCAGLPRGPRPSASKGCEAGAGIARNHNPRGDQIMETTKAYRDMTREERRAAAQARAQAALDRIGDGVRSVWESEEWAKWLRTLAKFHDYSLNNTMLIAMQMPEATRVASYRSWQRDFGRHVRRGERGIEVLVPMVVKSRLGDPEEAQRDDAEEATERRRLVGFKVGHVFDVSQTEGEHLPEIASQVSADVSDFDSLMGAIEAVSAYPIELVDGLPPETNGLFSHMGYIAIRAGMPQGQTVKTALHELTHSVLHDGDAEELPDRAMREVQAESVAYAVSVALGLDTSGYSFGYVASWAAGKTEEEMRQCMRAVRDAAKQILDRLQLVMEP